MKRLLLRSGAALGRSFFPILAIVIIAGTTLFGPWGSLALTLASLVIVLSFF